MVIPVPDGGVPRDAPALGDVGSFARDVVVDPPDAGEGIDAGTDAGTRTFGRPTDGCGCRVNGARSGHDRGVLLAGVVLALVMRRQRLAAAPKRSRSRLP